MIDQQALQTAFKEQRGCDFCLEDKHVLCLNISPVKFKAIIEAYEAAKTERPDEISDAEKAIREELKGVQTELLANFHSVNWGYAFQEVVLAIVRPYLRVPMRESSNGDLKAAAQRIAPLMRCETIAEDMERANSIINWLVVKFNITDIEGQKP